MMYRIDGELVAVGVVDFLPSIMDSVYFFYNPFKKYLNLGTFGAMYELNYLKENAKNQKYYFLGWYIHTCKKMNYKSTFRPSQLNCPYTHTWRWFDAAVREKLDELGHCRLAEGEDVRAPPDSAVWDYLVQTGENAHPMTLSGYSNFFVDPTLDPKFSKLRTQLTELKKYMTDTATNIIVLVK